MPSLNKLKIQLPHQVFIKLTFLLLLLTINFSPMLNIKLILHAIETICELTGHSPHMNTQ